MFASTPKRGCRDGHRRRYRYRHGTHGTHGTGTARHGYGYGVSTAAGLRG
jgi:hypothetical protein